MKIAAAAYPIDWHNRWNDYVGKLRVWVRTAAEQGAELLVFPEYGALELASLAGEDNARDPERVDRRGQRADQGRGRAARRASPASSRSTSAPRPARCGGTRTASR